MEFIDANTSLVLYEPYLEEYGKGKFHNGFLAGVYITIWIFVLLGCFRTLRFL